MNRPHRRLILASGLVAAASPLRAFAQQDDYPDTSGRKGPPQPQRTQPPQGQQSPSGPGQPGSAETYTPDEVVRAGSNFLGVTAEAMGGAVERVMRDHGRHPTGYIAGTEASAAFVGGLRYGKGVLYLKHREPVQVYWQGPSVGVDWGVNGARNFTLCYNLDREDDLFHRFPGVEGSAYFVGGIGVNYQKADDVVLAPMRAGLGLRLGANVGYLAYSHRRHVLPF